MKIRAVTFFLAMIFTVLFLVPSCGKDERESMQAETAESESSSQKESADKSEEGGDPLAIAPEISSFMTEDNYFAVQNFYIHNKKGTNSSSQSYEPIIAFSFVELSKRENTPGISRPYVFIDGFELDGYEANAYKIEDCLMGIYKPSFVRAVKTAPTSSELAEYGLYYEGFTEGSFVASSIGAPQHVISFDIAITDSKGRYEKTLRHYVYVSDITESDTYYAFTEIYELNSDGTCGADRLDTNTIVEIKAESFDFLSHGRYYWTSPAYTRLNIAFCQRIRLSTPDYSAVFLLDNSQSDCTTSVSSEFIKVSGLDSQNSTASPFTALTVRDANNNLWLITPNDVKCYSASGDELRITTAYSVQNAMDRDVVVFSGYIACADGSRVYVTADEVRVLTSGGETKYVRYSLTNFRRFYASLLCHSLLGDCDMSDAQIAQVIKSEIKLLSLEVTDTEGERFAYDFYRVDNDRALIYVNGKEAFYVKREMVEKVALDAQRFFADEVITAGSWE